MDAFEDGGTEMHRLHAQIDSELERARDGEDRAVLDEPDFVKYEAALRSLHGAVVVMEANEGGPGEA